MAASIPELIQRQYSNFLGTFHSQLSVHTRNIIMEKDVHPESDIKAAKANEEPIVLEKDWIDILLHLMTITPAVVIGVYASHSPHVQSSLPC